ncbi:hypothetical protein B0A55_07143 [Friedmanniomyces simplex]|uniref:Uncharacterized protein n=1 Tax=Friedmanniomyces simplex TaxID=329884 RepID=A0A4U0X6Z5_9PEZI|nr:hypothetical protein B0A55_07143 [Friedmanniomyces simplex]
MQIQLFYLLATTLAFTTAKRTHHQNGALANTCSSSACVEYINTCGLEFGGCYAACSSFAIPTYTDPGCPVTADRLAAISTCTITSCIDYINDCGIRYGGCYEACTGYTTPTYTVPACPTTTLTPTATLTTLAYAGIARQVAQTA